MGGFLMTLFWFLVVLTPVVFVHEFGHFWIARRNGVRVEAFSIGFGKELFGFTDRHGTRWKFSLVPLGGYVKMFGQNDLGPDEEETEALTEQERSECFFNKRLGQKASIVAAGPAANFLFAIVVFALMFIFIGQPFTPALVAEVVPGSAAERAGLQPGDLMTEVEGRSIQRFEEVQQLVRLHPGIEIDLVILRDGNRVALKVTPEARVEDDGLGEKQRIGVLGVRGVGREFRRHGPVTAAWQSIRETTRLVSITMTALGQIVSGDRGAGELGGPVRIAQMSGAVAEAGLVNLVIFAAFLSVNLGLINLFPIPLLDGGHLLFYGYEAIRGRPAGARAQALGLKIGLVLVMSLMVFATLNDLVRLPLIKQFVALIS